MFVDFKFLICKWQQQQQQQQQQLYQQYPCEGMSLSSVQSLCRADSHGL
jgi:hypothetical protein